MAPSSRIMHFGAEIFLAMLSGGLRQDELKPGMT